MPVKERITATPAALEELAQLRERHGPLLFFLSGGCCEGSFPLCLEEGELLLGPGDRLLGTVGGTPFYVDAEQDDRWNEPVLQLDVSSGETDTFSLENADRVHFVAHSGACALPEDGGSG
jgi:uncharacterized protein (DUF779 family)